MLQLMVGDSPFTHEHATLLNWFKFMINAAVKLYCFIVRGVYYFVHPIYINEAKLNNKHLSTIGNIVQQHHNPQHPRCSLSWTRNHLLSSHFYIITWDHTLQFWSELPMYKVLWMHFAQLQHSLWQSLSTVKLNRWTYKHLAKYTILHLC